MRLSKKACELLHKAQARLSRRGAWTQDSWGRWDKGYLKCCAVGAIRLEAGLPAFGGDVEHLAPKHVQDAIKALFLCVPGRYGGLSPQTTVTLYNDRKSTRKKDIIALFDRARGDC